MSILFVCTGNSFRSPLAEALAAKHIPNIQVESAGTSRASTIAETTMEFAEEEGVKEYIKE
ncbi:MAG: low molecular weight phosphatase family protein, partial [Candidatus Aenigmatarchaeota archaeon]